MATETRVALRVDPARLALVMDYMDRAEAAMVSAAKRRYTRYSFRTPAPVAMLCRRDDSAVRYEVAPRNISRRGMSVLFGGFVHPQTRCVLVLPSAAGGEVRVPGVLRWCRHVSRAIHEGGIEFLDAVDLGELLGEAPREEGGEPRTSAGCMHGTIEQMALRLATLARDQRSLTELREEFDRIRRTLEREEALARCGVNNG